MHGVLYRKRLAGAILACFALAGSVLVIAPSADAATGGGCNTPTQNGWRIGVCINASDSDIYVDTLGAGASDPSCRIVIYLDESGVGNTDVYQVIPCYTGHYYGGGTPAHGTYWNQTYVISNNSSTLEFDADSPTITK